MTLRQAIAILLSCYIYGHVITVIGIIGVAIVFAATFLNIYCGYQSRMKKSAPPAPANMQPTPAKEQNLV